jgi:hypothetical protein
MSQKRDKKNEAGVVLIASMSRYFISPFFPHSEVNEVGLEIRGKLFHQLQWRYSLL